MERVSDDVKGTWRGVFGLLLLAYRGNDCLDRSHLGSRAQGLRSVKAGRVEKRDGNDRERIGG